MCRFLFIIGLLHVALLTRSQSLSRTGVHLPLCRLHLNSAFGFRVHPLSGEHKFHAGIDLAARGDTIFAVLPGTVAFAGYDPGLGLLLILQHGNRLETVYGHLSQFWVYPGDPVYAGQPLGLTGRTGRVTGEHLHFALRYRQYYINPLAFLRALFRAAALPALPN